MFKDMGENIPVGNFLGGNFPSGNFPGGSLMGGNFPGGGFPDTQVYITKTVLRTSKNRISNATFNMKKVDLR